jgi:hypothetical protein
MASKPTDLTRKTWDKVKELTVPKTGLGAKLDEYQTAREKTEALPTRNSKAYKDAAAALVAVKKHLPEAEKKCNKTLHKNTIAALAAYKGLLDAEGVKLAAAETKYQNYREVWIEKRKKSLKELPDLMKRMADNAKMAIKIGRDAANAGKADDATAAHADGLKQLKEDYEACIKSVETWRVPPPAVEQPHVDDRLDVFGPLVKLSNDVETVRTQLDSALKKVPTATPQAQGRPTKK